MHLLTIMTSAPQGAGTFTNSSGQQLTRAAYFAAKAAIMRKQIGRDAALRHALRNGSTRRLFALACQLHAISS